MSDSTKARLKFLVVEIIRRLWDHGLYRQNKYLKMCHDFWFDDWVEWNTKLTMDSVDRQVAEINSQPVQLKQPTYSEKLHGETPLGGEMRLSYDFTEDSPQKPSEPF